MPRHINNENLVLKNLKQNINFLYHWIGNLN